MCIYIYIYIYIAIKKELIKTDQIQLIIKLTADIKTNSTSPGKKKPINGNSKILVCSNYVLLK